ncbi:MAG: Uma2 family endonuclease [Planctomycetaceae bacterium]|nr:Uma2 family endonuclease [Planctomycetaceae bacterium]
MSAGTPTKLITAVEFLDMDFDGPAELVRGEVLEMTRPGWKHGVVCGNVAFLLGQWRRQVGQGIVTTNDTGVLTERDPDTLRGPDLFYVSEDRLPKLDVPHGVPAIIPNLCVEVLSPSDRWSDVLRKASEYLALGVSEVWLIDPEDRIVQILRSDTATIQLRVGDQLTSQELSGFECAISLLFERS